MLHKTLSERMSPLNQARRGRRGRLGAASRKLSPADEATLGNLLAQEYDYVDSPAFKDRDAQKKLFDDAPPIRQPDTSWYHPVMDNATDHVSFKNVGTVLLTAAEERVLFLQYNYSRFMASQLRNQMVEQGDNDPDKARLLLEWHHKAERYRDQIAQTNLALVLAMAKRTRMSEMEFADMVSEGNMALLRAADKFDVGRGFKFSTYACRAILKAFSRSGIKFSKYRQLFPTDFDPKLEKSDYMERKRVQHEDDCADEIRQIIDQNRADLTDIEQEVIEHRFSVGSRRGHEDSGEVLTLEQVGKIIGVTKERVRQIQNKALEKIRHTLEESYLA